MTPRRTTDVAPMPVILNGSNGTMHLPLWARVIAMVGLPGALLCYLVYVGAQTLPSIQREIQTLRISYEKSQEIQRETIAKQAEIVRLMQRVCSNTAKSDQERARCFD